MEQAFGGPEDDPAHQRLATILHNCGRTKGLEDPLKETAHSLSSKGDLGETTVLLQTEDR